MPGESWVSFCATELGLEGSAMSDIPSEEDFERAKRLARERSRNLDSVCARVKERFGGRIPLRNVYILPQRDVSFRTYIFFCTNDDLERAEGTGVAQEIRDFVYEELERVGCGERDKTTVAFEFDSDENVEVNFEGDYLLRLR